VKRRRSNGSLSLWIGRKTAHRKAAASEGAANRQLNRLLLARLELAIRFASSSARLAKQPVEDEPAKRKRQVPRRRRCTAKRERGKEKLQRQWNERICGSVVGVCGGSRRAQSIECISKRNICKHHHQSATGALISDRLALARQFDQRRCLSL
jgi:hypothetical protein